MIVFVLTSNFDCEGESPIGVFANLDAAKSRGSKLGNSAGFEHEDWWNLIGDNNGERWELKHGSSSYIVRAEVVKGV